MEQLPVLEAKIAVTEVAVLPLSVHGSFPWQPPLHPVNVEPMSGMAVRVTTLPLGNDSLQSMPQAIPGGELITLPLPVPALLTVMFSIAWGVVPQASLE
jgi:hypothetical protein